MGIFCSDESHWAYRGCAETRWSAHHCHQLGIQVDWSFPADTGDTLQTELQYSVNGNGDNPLLLAGVPYPQHTYTQLGLKAGVEFWYRARWSIVLATRVTGPTGFVANPMRMRMTIWGYC